MIKLKFEAFIEQKKKFGLVDYPFFTIFILIKHRIKKKGKKAKKPLILGFEIRRF